MKDEYHEQDENESNGLRTDGCVCVIVCASALVSHTSSKTTFLSYHVAEDQA